MSAKYRSPSFLLPNELNTSANPLNTDGDPTTGTGINSLYSMDFDGTNNIDCGNISALNGATQATWSCWYRKTINGSPYFMATWGDVANTKQFIAYQFSTGMAVYMGKNTSGSNAFHTMFQNLSFGINVNTWYHMAFVFDASESSNADKLKFYLNGTPITNTVAGGALTSLNSVTSSFDIGGPTTAQKFTGNLDEVAIFNRALDSTERAALYDGTGSNIRPSNLMASNLNPVAYYPLGEQAQNSGYLSATGNEWQFPNGVLQDYVMDFDSTSPGDYISAPMTMLNSATQCTISFWGKKDASNKQLNVGGWESDSAGIWVNWYLDGNLYLTPRGTGATSFSVSYAQPYDNNWHHFLGVYDGSSAANCKLYLDGDLVATGSGTAPSSLPATTGDNFQIGALGTGYLSDGQISNVAVWNTAITDANQIANIYNNGSPQTSYTVSPQNWWKLNATSTARQAWSVLNVGNVTLPTPSGRYSMQTSSAWMTQRTGGLVSGVVQGGIEWYSPIINGNYSNINVSGNFSIAGVQASTGFKYTFYYSIDGGSYVEFQSELNTGALTNYTIANPTPLSFSKSIRIKVLASTGTNANAYGLFKDIKIHSGTELIYLEDFSNTSNNNKGIPAASSVIVPAIASNWLIPTALPIPSINYTTAGSFNGTSSKVDIASTSLGTSNTVSFWFYHNSSGSTFGTLAGGSTTTNPGLRSGLAFNIGGNSVYCSFDAAQFAWTNPWYATGNIKSDKWNHVVFVRDASKADADKIQLSINNSTLASYDTITFATPNFSTQTNIATIGQSFGGIQTLDGLMSSISTFTTAFTQSQVGTLYNSGQPSADISSLSPVNWWKLDTIGTTITDNGSGGNNGTNTDVTAATTDVKTSELNIPVNGVSTTLPSTALQQSDLQFDSPYSNYSLSFDGTGDYIDAGNDVSLQFSSSFTISAWVKIDLNYTGNNAIISKDSSASNGAGYHISFRTGNSVHAWSYDANSKLTATGLTTNTWYHIVFIFESTGGSNGNQSLYINAGTPVTNTITNFAASTIKNLRIGESEVLSGYNTDGKIDETALWSTALTSAQVLEIYNNGRPKDLTTFSGTAPISWWRLGENAYFNNNVFTVPNSITGAPNGTGSGTVTSMISADAPGTYANGIGTNLDILDRVGDAPLSTSNSQSYNMIPSDISPYVPSYVGTTIANAASMTFDGVDDFIDLGTSLSLANEFTISSWININNTTAGAKAIVYKGNTTISSYEFAFEVNRTSGKLSTLASVSGPVFTSNTTLVAGSWYHAALTKTIVGANITYTFFLNGQPDGTGTTTLTPNYSSGIAAIGKYGSSSFPGYFNGFIDEVALFNYALTADQIKFDIYEPTKSGTGLTANLDNNPNLTAPVAWYRMGD
jgi:hypothetical protein